MILVHIANAFVYIHKYGLENIPTLLFQACLDPYGEHNIPIYKTMPFDLFLLYVYNFTIVGSNVYLYLYLRKQTENNRALKDADRKREKRRNFIPAQIGIIVTVYLIGKHWNNQGFE